MTQFIPYGLFNGDFLYNFQLPLPVEDDNFEEKNNDDIHNGMSYKIYFRDLIIVITENFGWRRTLSIHKKVISKFPIYIICGHIFYRQ